MELIASLFRQQLEARNYDRVVEEVLTLEAQPAIGVKARLRNLRGMAFLMAVCDPDPAKAKQFTKPLEFAVKDFRKAVEADPKLIEAQVHLGMALFLKGGSDGVATIERRDLWSEARVVLASARERIVAPGRPDGHGLPYEAEAVFFFLSGETQAAVELLRTGRSSPWSARLLATMVAAKP
jgi:hypothetical protein